MSSKTKTGCGLIAWKNVGQTLEVKMVRNGQNTWVGMGFAPGSQMTNADMTFCQNRAGKIIKF